MKNKRAKLPVLVLVCLLAVLLGIIAMGAKAAAEQQGKSDKASGYYTAETTDINSPKYPSYLAASVPVLKPAIDSGQISNYKVERGANGELVSGKFEIGIDKNFIACTKEITGYFAELKQVNMGEDIGGKACIYLYEDTQYKYHIYIRRKAGEPNMSVSITVNLA